MLPSKHEASGHSLVATLLVAVILPTNVAGVPVPVLPPAAPFRLVRAVSPLFRDAAKGEQESSGTATPRCIINISSTSGTHGNSGQVGCAAHSVFAGHPALVVIERVAKVWRMDNVFCRTLLQQ
jgi:NAD(P)-dependent dehydrogenase (short-subunit alcohol dehydrogenase family)